MLIKRAPDVRGSEITPRAHYLNRREFMKGAGYAAAAAGVMMAAGRVASASVPPAPHGAKLPNVKPGAFSTTETKNSWEQITTYNNFYEFGVDKDEPAQYAHLMKTEPWTVKVEGECANKAAYHVEDIIKPSQLEERVYRLRCVEAWSMVIPWVGIPLADFIKRCEPTSKAKYVEFTTLYDTRQMPGTRSDVLLWPYVEGLRMDEATNPLTLLAVGLYGEVLPNQDGAPIRLIVPWKYGFKSVKSIVKIKFVESQPLNTWKRTTPSEYGFYANVNPNVDHPRWSQATERRIGEFFKRKTLMFNGYADQVAGMYAGMDLRKNF